MRYICSGYPVNNLIKCYTVQFKEVRLILIRHSYDLNNEYTEIEESRKSDSR